MYDENAVRDIQTLYQTIKGEISAAARGFLELRQKADLNALFKELAFCLFTPQSNAHACWRAIEALDKNGLLWTGEDWEFYSWMPGVRFHKTKARRVTEARQAILLDKSFDLYQCLRLPEEQERRKTLYQNIKGLGWKECSHFLRNTGAMVDLAILDRHILRNMVALGIISHIPSSLSEKNYLVLESKLQEFSQKIGIPMHHLDMLFWYKSQGELFK